jgi:uncharacterized RDD family membrane protein YckC
MPCLVCGDICRCSPDAKSTPPGGEHTPEDSLAWRRELAVRLNRYQARRKPRPPRYPSLRLRFDTEVNRGPDVRSIEPQPLPQTPAITNQALALDGFADLAAQDPLVGRSELSLAQTDQPIISGPAADLSERSTPNPAPPKITAKIIEFPRSWTPPPAPPDQLAEPVIDRPRILEAPEIVPPPPALGGITIEPAPRLYMGKQPGIDVPLRLSSLPRRIFSAAIDAVIVLMACTLFAAVFWELTAIRPPRLQIMAVAAGLFVLFWFAYQFLLMIYSGTTPGLLLMRLEVSRFDGSLAGRRLRMWRVLSSFLAAASLGMGYVWVLLDEDVLCWHDRITRTYLARKIPKDSAVLTEATPRPVSRPFPASAMLSSRVYL